MNFRYRLMQFMSGRYGMDKLFYGIFTAAVILSFINLFVRSWVIQLAVYALVFYGLFRVLSRNSEARLRENRWFTDKLGVLKRKRDFQRQKQNDKFHIYKKCPACKAVLRLPHRVGSHKTVCPRCGKEFSVKVRK